MNEHTAQRAARLTRTKADILIGCAYVEPPAPQSADADRIQAALLAEAERRRDEWHAKAAEVVIMILAAGLALAAIFGKFA